MKLICLILAFLIFPAHASAHSAASKPEAGAKSRRRLDVRVNHLTDLSHLVRKYATAAGELPKNVEGFDAAVGLARQLNKEFGGWDSPAWSGIEIALTKYKNASEAQPSDFRETVTSRQGAKIAVRDAAVRYAKALSAVEASYLKNVWPQHRANVERAAADIDRVFTPKEKECFAYFTKNLGMDDAQLQVPVYLVNESPWPGGFTLWSGDARIIVISVEAHKGSNLYENLLHEAIHALDLETKGKGNVLVEIRDRLLKAGLSDKDSAVRHGPHWLVFIQAGETVRRILDPSHSHYGKELYVRLQRMSKADVPAVWTAHLDGKLSREDATTQIVEGFLKAHGESAPPKSQ